MTEEKAALMKVSVLGDDGKIVLGRVLPDLVVGGFAQADVSDVPGMGILFLQRTDKPMGMVLIE